MLELRGRVRLASAIALVGLAGIGGSAVLAIDVGCIDQGDADATVVVPPEGQVTNFTPDCVVIDNGGTVEWSSLDPHGPHRRFQAHNPTIWGCFEAEMLETGETASVELVWHEHNETVTAVSSDGSMTECSTYGPLGRQLVHVHDDRVEIQYFCQVHPISMIAKFIIPR